MNGNQKRSLLVVISAPSGAGKTTLCKKLLEDFPELVLSISSTTRAPRGAEKNGVEYFFLTREAFETKIRENGFAEWAQVHGNYYGTSKEVIQKGFASGLSVLLDIDVQGAAQLKQAFPDQCLRIFVAPPSLDELEKRLRDRRTDSEESIQKRMNNARAEMEASKNFDHTIINDSLERAYAELSSLLEAKTGMKRAKSEAPGRKSNG